MGILGGGGYAEYARLPAAHAMRVPSNLDDAQAAALPEAFLTAYSNLLEIGGLLSRQTALIHAGASGVGLAAIQIAKQIGAKTVVTASAGKHEVCLAHGADRVLDYRAVNFAEVILQDSDGVDVVLDFLGASTFADNLRVLKPWGKLVIVGLMGGADVQADLSLLMRKNLTLAGSTLRGRTAAQKAGLTQRFWHWAEPLFLTGALRPTVWRVLDWTEVETAHRLMAENQNAGKIVLKIGA
jgi:NADPH:quinone reductase-like Zn-dependent oxidoreductase